MGGLGTEFCIDCEQFFCMNCKSLHRRMKGTKNHEFQSGGNIVPEVRLRCEEHKEDLFFVVTNARFLFACDVSVESTTAIRCLI